MFSLTSLQAEIMNICICKPGIFELADTEMELFNHFLQASDPKLHIRILVVDMIVVVIIIIEKLRTLRLTNGEHGLLHRHLYLDIAADRELSPTFSRDQGSLARQSSHRGVGTIDICITYHPCCDPGLHFNKLKVNATKYRA